jgi:hypothetical protein
MSITFGGGWRSALKEARKQTWKSKRGLICQKMIVKLKIQLFAEKIWNLKASQMRLKSILRHFQRVRSINIHSNENKGLDKPNFITLGKISEQEKIEIIQIGFQRQAEGKISLKKYYESTDPNSLFQSKGYFIKYESIRRTKFYQQLKPLNN